MEELFYSKLWDAVVELFNSFDWFFIVIFLVVSFLAIEWIRFLLKKWELNKAAITLFALALGILIAVPYAYVYGITDKAGLADLFYSILFGMVLYKIGIDKLFEYLKNKWTKK